MKEFLKSKTYPLAEHQEWKIEEILFPDEKKYHIAFMGMTFLEQDKVIINTDQITLSSGECNNFQLNLRIEGITNFAKSNN